MAEEQPTADGSVDREEIRSVGAGAGWIAKHAALSAKLTVLEERPPQLLLRE